MPERADHAGLDELDLRCQPALAVLDLGRERIAVARRAALEDVGDEHLVAAKTDLGEQAVEQGTRLADERQSLAVLVGPGRLADEHEVRVGVAGAEDDGVPGLDELRAEGALPRLLGRRP